MVRISPTAGTDQKLTTVLVPCSGFNSVLREGTQVPRQEEDRAQPRGFPASRAGRFQEEGGNTPPSSWPQAPTPPGHCPPQGPPYCHTGPATWPVISGQREGEVKPDLGGGSCGKSPDWSSGAGHTLRAALLLCKAPPLPPSPGLVPALGQGRPWPRPGCTLRGARKGK